MDLETLVEKRDEGVDNFNVDPPNAELSIYEADGDQHPVLIVTTPAVEADSISFAVEVIDEKIPGSFGHATLFIDDMPDPEFGLRPHR